MASIDGDIDYTNSHGTSTPVGDVAELCAVKEAIYTLLMMKHGFVAGSANIDKLDDEAEGLPIATESYDATITQAMSNSFGVGGTNATLIFQKYTD